MDSYVKTITLDVNADQNYTIVKAKQGDKINRKIAITLKKDGTNFTPTGVSEIWFRVEKPDKNIAIVKSTDSGSPISVSGNVYTVSLSEQCLTASGKAWCDLAFLDSSGNTLSSCAFIMNIIPMPNGNTAESTSEWTELQKAIDDAERFADIVAFRTSGNYIQYTVDGQTWTNLVNVGAIGGDLQTQINERMLLAPNYTGATDLDSLCNYIKSLITNNESKYRNKILAFNCTRESGAATGYFGTSSFSVICKYSSVNYGYGIMMSDDEKFIASFRTNNNTNYLYEIGDLKGSLNSAHFYFSLAELGLSGTPTMETVLAAMPDSSIANLSASVLDLSNMAYNADVSYVMIFRINTSRTFAIGARTYVSVNDANSRFFFSTYQSSSNTFLGWFEVTKKSDFDALSTTVNDKVSKSGDTMTGQLVIKNVNESVRTNNFTLGTVPSSNAWGFGLKLEDTNGQLFGSFAPVYFSDGSLGIQLGARYGSSGEQHILRMRINSNGVRTVELDAPSWINALSYKSGDTVSWNGNYNAQFAGWCVNANHFRVTVPLARPIAASSFTITRMKGALHFQDGSGFEIDTTSGTETVTFANPQILEGSIGFTIVKTGAYTAKNIGMLQLQHFTMNFT